MGFEAVYLMKEVELLVDTSGAMTLHVLTEMPGSDVRERAAIPFNTETTTTGWLPVRCRLPGATKGQIKQLRIDGPSVVRIQGVRVHARPLNGGDWNWYPVPVVETPEGYAAAALPIVPTPEGYAAAALPIVPTPEGYAAAELPIRATPAEPGWSDLTMDE